MDGKLCQLHRCQICNKAFQHLRSLRKHEREHGEERPFRCDQCGKEFKQHGSLRRHELIHTGIRPFKCDECGKEFSRSDCLKSHKITHRNSSERPYFKASTLTAPTAEDICATAALIKEMISIAGL
ncbi:zinc finger, C2H2 type [Onchocerca flexuosa]|uniref:Zinc finger, C2H2 type n=1 Tax=Onchocerca flexuosa TaxID=387005 RepID=A0A238BL07_9BILA|nr:zinc finger, C2H2 type [Onchocerca flexuosa]